MAIINALNKQANDAFTDLGILVQKDKVRRGALQLFVQKHNSTIVDRKIAGEVVDFQGKPLFAGATKDKPIDAVVVAMPTMKLNGTTNMTEVNVFFTHTDQDGFVIECIRAVELIGWQPMNSILQKVDKTSIQGVIKTIQDAMDDGKSVDGWEDPA